MNFEIILSDTTEALPLVYESDIVSLETRDNLCNEKGKIDSVYKEWDKVKRSIHDHEYIYTSSSLHKNIAQVNPVSRSYFKMKEMLQEFKIDVKDIHVTCLAEAPGGFIQALLEESIQVVHGITLVSEDSRVPYWDRCLKNDSRVRFQFGKSKDGDLYNYSNILSYIETIGKHTMDLITGDGGFDNSDDYNRQEINSLRLIYSEIYVALHLQKQGGTFICKVFDTFEKETILLLYILWFSYETVSLYKPHISRVSNSEKYVICRGYKGYKIEHMNHLTHHFTDCKISFGIQPEFVTWIHGFNQNYSRIQIQSIHRGLQYIKQKHFHNVPTQFQIDIAIEWCKKYNIPINQDCHYIKSYIKSYTKSYIKSYTK